jgi:hypothetical protein
MFRKLITIPMSLKYKLNQRFFSTCNNRCKVNELTSKLDQQELYLETIYNRIAGLTILSLINIMVSLIF